MKIPAPPPDATGSLTDLPISEIVAAMQLTSVATDRYLPWESFRFHGAPPGLTVEQWWTITGEQRASQMRPVSLLDAQGKNFRYALPDDVLRLEATAAAKAGGNIGMHEPVTNPETRDTYVVRSLMEESITSSQLEGAATTRRVAKEMLRTGRTPHNKSEQMIWNNYQAMLFIQEHRDEALTPGAIRELHSIVTFDTLDDPDDAGRLQGSDEERVHVGTPDGYVLHAPPPAAELPARLEALCAFANAATDAGPWLHPILRAIIVHFMVGHDHFFVDGNGRLARALFYWVMLRQGLWLTEYITISKILKRAPVQYAHAYLNTEYQSDLTYFLIHQLKVLDRAFDELDQYVTLKVSEQRTVREHLHGRHDEFNHRQLALIEHALADPNAEFTTASHATSHHVTIETARTDLSALEEVGALRRSKRGRAFVWSAAPEIRPALGITSP